MIKSEQEIRELYARLHPAQTSQQKTLLGFDRFKQAYQSVIEVDQRSVPGTVVECGLYKGGSLAIMALAVEDLRTGRAVWGFDTFEGHPVAMTGQSVGHNRGTVKDVVSTCQSVGLDIIPTLVKGLVQDTLPARKSEISPIAVLRIDVDHGPAITCCLEELYDLVSPGGIITIDDYGHWPEAADATDKFRKSRRIESELCMIDYTGVFWYKE